MIRNTNNIEDIALVEKVLHVDKELFVEIVKRYQNKIFAYLYRMLNGNKEDAKDVTNETFLKAYKNLQTYSQKQSFSAWLYRIAHNECLNYIRKHRATKLTSLEHCETDPHTLYAPHNVPQAIDAEELRKQIRLLLDELPPKFKEVLILHYYEEKGYEEIADIIKKPVSTVGTYSYRAKQQLKKIVKKRKKEKYFHLSSVLLVGILNMLNLLKGGANEYFT